METMQRADLHCHTTCSDGTLTPQEVVDLAIKQKVTALAITDHDSIDAYPAVFAAGAKAGLSIISGVEFSTMHLGVSVHILAYSFSIDSPIIQLFCADHQKRREARMENMLFLLKKAGMPITEGDLYGIRGTKRGIGRPHLAQAMVTKGYVSDIKQAFKLYLGEGKSCYCSGHPISTEETLSGIKEANGFTIIAHPHLIDSTSTLKSLLTMPFDGLECYYARFSKQQNQRWVDIAKHRGWMISGGSDFHGAIKPLIPLGCAWTPEETFSILYQRFIENQRQ